MTTIVWDGKTLAADKQATFDGLKRKVTKIRKIKGHLIFSAGIFGISKELEHWWESGADPKEYPEVQKTDKWNFFYVITPDRKIFCYEQQPYPFQLEEKIIVCGCGRDYALGAMYMGADAVKAVEAACKYDIYSGCGIDTLTL